MPTEETTTWGIHAGKTGDADTLFLTRNRIAIGWVEMGDPTSIPPNLNAFETRVADVYPGIKPGAVVVYPSKRDHQVHLGIVQGPYEYRPHISAGYPNQRTVKWVKAVPRTKFTQGALYVIGAAMSLFQVKNYSHEFLAALAGEPPAGTDDTVLVVAEEIEQNTRDFILKRLSQELKGHPLCGLIANLLGTMGYRTRVAEPGPDGGIDILAHRDELGFEPPIIKVQVKSADGNVGEPVLSSLYGQVGTGEYGLLITLGAFTSQARNFAKGKSNLRLIDGNDLVDLVLEHYEALDSPYKAVVPLKRVYVPQPLEEGDQ